MYSKGAGKGGKHNWVNKATNVASLSYILVLLWEQQWQGKDFRLVVTKTASHHAYRYAHIPYQRILYVTRPNELPEFPSAGCMRIGSSFFGIWNLVASDLTHVKPIVAELLRKKRNVAADDDD